MITAAIIINLIGGVAIWRLLQIRRESALIETMREDLRKARIHLTYAGRK